MKVLYELKNYQGESRAQTGYCKKCSFKAIHGFERRFNRDCRKKSKETTYISRESPKKTDAPQSASQTSTSHFSSVSTPEYRSGWDKIFGKPKIETVIVEPLSKCDQRKALVAEQWHKYQALKNPKHLAVICRELPFFDHPEVGDEIAKLLMDK